MKRAAVLAVVAAAACTDAKTEVDPNATAIEVGVMIDPALGVDQLLISGRRTDDGTPAFDPGVLPEVPRPLGASVKSSSRVKVTTASVPSTSASTSWTVTRSPSAIAK